MASSAAADPGNGRPDSLTQPETGPFVLRSLFANVPLCPDGSRDDIKINCVEYLDNNLYVGTSDSELIHFVQIPPDPTAPPDDPSASPTFILASRLRPAFTETSSGSRPGIQQILLLPRVSKACILCNWTVTFYTLPELSPAFGTAQVKNCSWIGGVDLNDLRSSTSEREPDGVTILLSLNKKIQVVRIGDGPRVLGNIDYAGSTISLRRDAIACVADSRSYALLEIDRQLKIPLMSISSLDQQSPAHLLGRPQHISGATGGGLIRSNSSAQSHPRSDSPATDTEHSSHRRGTSLGDFITSVSRRQDNSSPAPSADDSEPVIQHPATPEPVSSPYQPPPAEPAGTPAAGSSETPQPERKTPPPPAPPPKPRQVFLKPHIVSPSPEEFLLVTGTGPLEPGIGMFVNLDGDPTRPTIQFDRYPKDIVVDGGVSDLSSSQTGLAPEEEGYVIASMGKDLPHGLRHGLEIQRWDGDAGQTDSTKYWLEPPATDAPPKNIGIRAFVGAYDTHFPEIVKRICRRRFKPFAFGVSESSVVSLRSLDSRTALSMERVNREKELFERDNDSQSDVSLPEGWEASRNIEEDDFARRLAGTTARLAVWSGDNIWWAMRNPFILQMDSRLDLASQIADATVLRCELFAILNSIRGREPRTELEFYTLDYIRQRAGIVLMTSFLRASDSPFSEPELRGMEEVLIDGRLDARVVLSLIPGVRNEVIETKKGIWIFGGVMSTAEQFISKGDFDRTTNLSLSSLPRPVLHFLKRFLTVWRQKKGFGSVADEQEVSRTVDAALLAVLLELDQGSPPGLARGPSIRQELYELVDNGVDCFERAETLIESYHRLFVLSRLYQSRKMASEVLSTWRRIIEGERDDGGELRDAGEQRVREYLSKIGNQSLVQEYGLWLANRNPKLGVQVFADERQRAPHFQPSAVVSLLRQEAPAAVRYYLEHLVFDKQGHADHVSELIAYYVDVVTSRLRESAEAREAVMATYAAYRALTPPKPTYRQFLSENSAPAGEDEAWDSRLRLLQLLGGADYDYDASVVRARIAAGLKRVDGSGGASVSTEGGDGDDDLLVPETIILAGREQKHEDALRLLVHRLGDYDTAVAYCLRGGASIYSIYRARQAPPRTEEIAAMEAAQSRAVKGQKRGAQEKQAERAREQEKAEQEQQEGREKRQTQHRLFRALFSEFLRLEDLSERAERTGLLLERFGTSFFLDDNGPAKSSSSAVVGSRAPGSGYYEGGPEEAYTNGPADDVLASIPDSWPVDVVAAYLVKALRRLAADRHASTVARALSSTQNLAASHDLVVEVQKAGGSVET